jgi:hypothetical protein
VSHCEDWNAQISLFSVFKQHPLKLFFGQILLKLAGNVHTGKNEIPLFCFIFKMNTNEEICIKQFLFFLTVRTFLGSKLARF